MGRAPGQVSQCETWRVFNESMAKTKVIKARAEVARCAITQWGAAGVRCLDIHEGSLTGGQGSQNFTRIFNLSALNKQLKVKCLYI